MQSKKYLRNGRVRQKRIIKVAVCKVPCPMLMVWKMGKQIHHQGCKWASGSGKNADKRLYHELPQEMSPFQPAQ